MVSSGTCGSYRKRRSESMLSLVNSNLSTSSDSNNCLLRLWLFTCDLPVRPYFRLSDGHEGQEVVSNF